MAENAEKKEARYAHSEGHVNVCYDDNGGHLISSGSEGEVRVYAGYDDDDPSHHAMGGCVYSMAVKNQKFYSSCDDNTIAVHTFPSWEKDGLITRFTAPVTHMTFDESGETLVAGSADFTVKVVDVVTSSEQVLRGHEAPVLSVALHPQGGYVASSSCDGTLRLWSTEQQRVVHTITGFPKSNDFSAALLLCRMAWDKSGKYLAVPFEKGVRVYNQGIWDIAFTLSDKFIEKSLSIVTFSPSGEYLASAAVDGSLIVWNFQEKRCLTRMRHPQRLRVTSLAWDKSGIPELVYGDANGHIGLFQDVIPADEDRKKVTDDGLTAEQLADLFEDDENMAKDDIDHDEIAALKKVALGLDEDSLGLLNFNCIHTDTGSIQGNAAHVQPPPTRIVEVGFKPTPAQPAFQPSSTPVNWSHRYMVWNTVGLALQYSTDEEQSVVVEFHDTATHHPLHIPNGPGYTMAALSDQALVLAAPSDGEAVSQVVCMHFNAWDKSKEWTCGMPEEEDIEAICIGEGWLAVATNMRHVRVFTVAGLQKDIFSIPGPVVAMAAHSNQLFIVYHSGMGLPGDQCLGFRLMYVAESKKKSVVDSAALPLSPSSTLAWIGFTSEGTPTIVDSSGAVRLFNRSFAQTWSQIASLRNHCKGKSDNYWVIGLVENPPQMRAIQVKGGKHPATLPRPTPHVLPLQIPLCNISNECGSLEEAYGRQKLLSQHMDWWTSQNYDFDEERQQKSQMSQSESLMKLFALACKSERLCRAIEICELMPHEHTLQLAIKYASRLRLLTLAEKISDLIRRRMAEAAVAVEEEEEEEEEEEQEQGWVDKIL
ncbi:hypothetical protein CAPTEDRAFT_108416 [Capitella teleta]|uniref:Uncharacterized protein n=1 Tax=Capitella teleta TaxID=283909 RepID=R7U8R4_CAPTE|nr:hypothetical protein CAPTEDRAFT_108416 [Capitella teleta]|eukprot:ELT99505.1 hypothetical protein CAPTEDRAFT_108416 [Capitella teleta]